MKKRIVLPVLLTFNICFAALADQAAAPEAATPVSGGETIAPVGAKPDVAAPADALLRYVVQPGDVLQVSVWKEQDLQADVLIRPDGGLSFPLAGELMAAGKTVAVIREELTLRIRKYIPEAIVTVAIKQPQGNRVYVVGRVNRPGEYITNREVDVMQALSLAGGATPFAVLNSIKVLRRTASGQQAIPFRYSDVEKGRNLEQNIVLQGGDVVVVP